MEPRNTQELADRLLDAALPLYGSAEPRAGLESRVLAGLTMEQERIASSAFNWWLVPAGAAILVVVASVVFVPRRTGTATPAAVSSSNKLAAVSPGPTPPTQLGLLRSARNPSASRKIHPVIPETTEPRLEQFPSPRPLSQEEELLRAFVTEASKERLVMATAITKAEKLEIKSLEVPSLEGDSPDSRSHAKDQ